MTGTAAAPAATALPDDSLVIVETPPPERSAWGSIFLMAGVLFGAAMMPAAFGPLQEAVRIDLKLSDLAMSLILGLGQGIPVALLGLPLSWLIDHGNRTRLAQVLLAVCILGSLSTSFVHGFYDFLAVRALATLGAGTLLGAMISRSADLMQPAMRGRALVIMGFGLFAGAAFGLGLSGALLKAFGQHAPGALAGLAPWRQGNLVVGLIGAALTLPILLMREPQRREVEIKTPALGPVLTALWAKRAFLAPLFIGQIGVTMADTAGTIWATPVLIRNYHLQPADFSGWMAVALLIAGVLGSILGGIGADLGHRTSRRGGLLIAGVIAAAVGIPASLFPIMPSVGLFSLLFFVLALHGAVTSVMVTTAVVVLLPNEERGACSASFGVINAIVGLSLAPIIVTVAAKAMGGDQHLAVALAATGVVTGFFSLAGYLLAMRNAPQAMSTAPVPLASAHA